MEQDTNSKTSPPLNKSYFFDSGLNSLKLKFYILLNLLIFKSKIFKRAGISYINLSFISGFLKVGAITSKGGILGNFETQTRHSWVVFLGSPKKNLVGGGNSLFISLKEALEKLKSFGNSSYYTHLLSSIFLFS